MLIQLNIKNIKNIKKQPPYSCRLPLTKIRNRETTCHVSLANTNSPKLGFFWQTYGRNEPLRSRRQDTQDIGSFRRKTTWFISSRIFVPFSQYHFFLLDLFLCEETPDLFFTSLTQANPYFPRSHSSVATASWCVSFHFRQVCEISSGRWRWRGKKSGWDKIARGNPLSWPLSLRVVPYRLVRSVSLTAAATAAALIELSYRFELPGPNFRIAAWITVETRGWWSSGYWQ